LKIHRVCTVQREDTNRQIKNLKKKKKQKKKKKKKKIKKKKKKKKKKKNLKTCWRGKCPSRTLLEARGSDELVSPGGEVMRSKPAKGKLGPHRCKTFSELRDYVWAGGNLNR
jgi:hypothetical protein